jgi:phosphate transport system protein
MRDPMMTMERGRGIWGQEVLVMSISTGAGSGFEEAGDARGTDEFRSFPTDSTERRITQIRKRVVREGTLALSMLEKALQALWKLDAAGARAVRLSDDEVDQEEIAIEQDCYELLALHRPFAHDFRQITFSLRVNADLERIADHASSIAKIVIRIREAVEKSSLPKGHIPQWPTALLELAQRVPAMGHETMRAILDEDEETARRLVAGDRTIDELEKRLFDEVRELIRLMGRDDAAVTIGMLTYRAGRELERVGDLLASTAEDVVYLKTGQIIRHEKRRVRNQMGPASSSGSSSGGSSGKDAG